MPYGYMGFQTGANFAASGMNAAIQAAADRKAYKRQLALLKKQQEWSEYMSNTAHQREVKDLRAAGLNPILSATGGSGAAVPSVSAPSVHSGSYGDFESPDVMNFAEGVSRLNLNDSTAKKAKADAELAEAKAKEQKMENKLTEAKVNVLKPALGFSKDVSSSSFWNDVTRGIKELLKPPNERYTIKANSAKSSNGNSLSPKVVLNEQNHSKNDHGKVFKDKNGRPYKFHYYKDGVYKYEYLDL